MAILVRPHGANQEVYRKVSAPNVRVWFRDQALPDSPESFAEFDASLRYSACAIGLNTTGMVDALVADRPVIAMLVPEYSDTNASQAVHFKHVLDADVYMRATSPQMCSELVSEVLDGKDPKRGNRRRFALNFVRPYGIETRAGEIAAKAIEMASRGMTGHQINEQIVSVGHDGVRATAS